MTQRLPGIPDADATGVAKDTLAGSTKLLGRSSNLLRILSAHTPYLARWFIGFVAAASMLLAATVSAFAQSAGSAESPDVLKDLAPTGKLRAAINLGNSVLAQTDAATGQPHKKRPVIPIGRHQRPLVDRVPAPDAVVLQAGPFVAVLCERGRNLRGR